MKRQVVVILLAILALRAAQSGCGGNSTGGGVGPVGSGATPTPCGVRCAPPAHPAATGHAFQNKRFSLTYLDPFAVVKHDDNSVILEFVNQSAGNVFDVKFAGLDVPSGTSAAQLLTAVEKQLNLGQLAGAQDLGPIYGAEIGYVAGVGDIVAGTENQANAPNSPVVVEVMACTRGTTGMVFIAVSTLNPNTQHPDALIQSANSEYDQFINSVVW